MALALCAMPSPAAAGWLGFRNDLSQAVIVQTYTECQAGTRLGTPHRLYPNETTWDWVSDHSVRKLLVSDAQSSKNALLRGVEVSIGKEDVLYNLQRAEKGIQLRKAWEGKRPR
jgi:hypothetical protein